MYTKLKIWSAISPELFYKIICANFRKRDFQVLMVKQIELRLITSSVSVFLISIFISILFLFFTLYI